MAGLMVRGAGDAAGVAGADESGVMGAGRRARSKVQGARSGSCSGSRVGCEEARDTRATTGAAEARKSEPGVGNSSVNGSSLIHSRERSYF
jgi:hypothetical protein